MTDRADLLLCLCGWRWRSGASRAFVTSGRGQSVSVRLRALAGEMNIHYSPARPQTTNS